MIRTFPFGPLSSVFAGYLDVDDGAKHFYFHFFESRRNPDTGALSLESLICFFNLRIRRRDDGGKSPNYVATNTHLQCCLGPGCSSNIVCLVDQNN
jgi:hypothetical protein